MDEKIKKAIKIPGKLLRTCGCVCSCFAQLLPTNRNEFTPEDIEKLRFYGIFAADLHTDGDGLRDRNNILRKALSGMSRSLKRADVLVLAGDITNAGHIKEYRHFSRMLRIYSPAQRMLPQMGNHDSGGTSEDKVFSGTSGLFRAFCEKQGIITDKNYYREIINGYHLIVLGTEQMLQNEAFFSAEQLAFLRSSLTEAEKSGKPVFIINHQPLDGSLMPDGNILDMGLGQQSSELLEIMRSFAQQGYTLFYISGHIHKQASPLSLQNEGSLYFLSLPSLQYDDNGGEAFIIEAYDEKLILRARNFIKNRYINKTDFTVTIK